MEHTKDTAPGEVRSSEQLGAGAEARYAGLASDQRLPDGKPRFTVRDNGRWLDDGDFIFDAMLKITGDFTDEDRIRFAQWVADTLNAADAKLPRAPRAPNG